MKRLRPFGLAASLLGLFACDEPAPEKQQGPETQGGGGYHGTGGGGGGDVAIGAGEEGKSSIVDTYQLALGKIKERDWDGAREALLDALRRSDDKGVQAEIRKHLKLVEEGILTQPTVTGPDLLKNAPTLYEKKVSMRGQVLQPGQVGKVTYYFWLQSGKKIQCRYDRLDLSDKKIILSLQDGSQALVRGTLKSPWGTNPNPYLELNYFRLEKLAPKPAEGEKAKAAEGAN